MFPLTEILSLGGKILDKVIPDPEAKAKAQLELAKLASDGKLADIQADITEAQELTKRLQADMSSDSWLSKNIRPMVLVYLLTAYLLFAILDGTGFKISEAYVTLLGQWGMLVMSFYFGSRGMEKIAEIWAKAKKNEPK